MKNEATILLQGDIRGKNQLERMNTELSSAWNGSDGSLIVDLSGVRALDYDTVTALLSFRNGKPAGSIHIRNIPEAVGRIISTFHIPV